MDKELDNLNHIADGRILATKDELQALITKEKNKLLEQLVFEATQILIQYDDTEYANGGFVSVDSIKRRIEE
jgi:hypothetical protein